MLTTTFVMVHQENGYWGVRAWLQPSKDVLTDESYTVASNVCHALNVDRYGASECDDVARTIAQGYRSKYS